MAATIVDIIRRHAAERPSHRAITFLQDGEHQEQSTTYQELDVHSRVIAACLQAQKLDGPVLLFYPPGLAFIKAFLGCLYAGIIAVPFAPPRPRRDGTRISSLLRDSGAKLAMAPTLLIDRLQRSGFDFAGNWLASDALSPSLSEKWRAPNAKPGAVAYLQYTSGSIHDPKGVMVSHANLLHNLTCIDHVFEHSSDSISVSWLPHFHDMGLVYGILQPLYGGYLGVLMPPAAFLQKPARWLQAITAYQATHSGGPDFAYDLCQRRVTPDDRANLNLASWSVAFSGAELVRKGTLDSFLSTFKTSGFKENAFRPAYGLAESTLMVSARSKDKKLSCCAVDLTELACGRVQVTKIDAPGSRAVVGCGAASDGVRLDIVNPETSIVCGGNEVGEIWVAGSSVALGYWRRESETSETFHATLRSESRVNYLRTGDLGFLRDGELFVTGRLKEIIVVRGYNLYPEDIELTAARAHNALGRSCAAFSIELEGRERVVIVQEIPRRCPEPARVIVDAIRAAVAAEHGLQVHCVVLVEAGKIPKTSSGKIQRRGCATAFLQGRLEHIWIDTMQSVAAREDNIEVGDLRDILARILSLKPNEIAGALPLTSYGLDSLLAAEISNAIQEKWGVIVGMAELLDGMSFGRLTSIVESGPSSPEKIPRTNPAKEPNLGRLSFEQERLWTLNRISPNCSDFNIAAALRFQGTVEVDILEQCLTDLIFRHEVLRASFMALDGEPRQVIGPTSSVRWAIANRGIEALNLHNEVMAERQKPFDLGQAPLIRATLMRVGMYEHVLVLVAHHIIADAQSLFILTSEIATLYVGRSSGRVPVLPEPVLCYQDFVTWQCRWLANEVVERHVSYWKEQLAELPNQERHSIRDTVVLTERRCAFYSFDISKNTLAELRARCLQKAVTPFMWLLSVFDATIFECSGEKDLMIGVPVDGRTRPELESIVGFLAHPVVMRAHVNEGMRFSDLLDAVRQITLGALAHQELPLVQIANSAQFRRKQLFRMMLNFVRQQQLAVEAAHVSISLADVPVGTTDQDLFLTLIQHPEKLRGWIQYDAAIFSADWISKFVARFSEIMNRSLWDEGTTLRAPVVPDFKDDAVLAVAGTFRVELLESSLRFWINELRLRYAIRFASHVQVWQELLDRDGLFRSNSNGLNVLLVRFEDWDPRWHSEGEQSNSRAQALIGQFLEALDGAVQRSSVPYLICLCPPSPGYVKALGGLHVNEHLQDRLAAEIDGMDGVYAVTARELMDLYPVESFYDAYGDLHAQMPFTPLFLTALGTMIVRQLNVLIRRPKKVIVLDCDQTLWTGVCGEAGPLGVVLEPARVMLQEIIRERGASGMLLCLCSKNNESDVAQVFEQRREMPLRLDHFVAWRINWKPKVENIRSLADQLSLDVSDFIFVDDDPFECAQVRMYLPEVLTIQLPGDVGKIPHYLRHIWAFDTLKTTAEANRRTATYREAQRRTLAQQASPTLEDFLRSLELNVRISEATEPRLARVAELFQRTTQFNASTPRWSREQIRALVQNGHCCLVTEATDRFGDYGLVGVTVFQNQANALEVSAFLLSCRALGRGIEQKMLESLVLRAREQRLEFVDICFVESSRNRLALEFLEAIPNHSCRASRAGITFRFGVAGAARV